ncbi:hypothetical protein [Desulfovirgula thermocuniculi]|uniref:hypothetical protein n=1 Tax=Desulfovirgula thermocuniculi TaxID=348842 RepID=UPI0012EBBED8|nr:hypothetical protein [Desulfovirgula thermocuniculi]
MLGLTVSTGAAHAGTTGRSAASRASTAMMETTLRVRLADLLKPIILTLFITLLG